MIHKHGTLTKISDDVFNGNHPNGIFEGYSQSGFFSRVIVGEEFYVISGHDYLRTSEVKKIISETDKEIIFKTLNSIYKLEIK